MQSIKEKIKYLFLHFISPKEIIFIFCLLFISLFFLLVFLYKSSTYVMGTRIVYAGAMNEGIIGSPKNTNPFKPDNQTDKDLNKLLYTSIIRNLYGNKFDLGIAKSVDVSSDKLSYKLTLKSNIYFSNGTPITVDDVLYSLNQVPQEKNYTVDKTSDNVLTFTLKSDSAKDNFLTAFTYPIIPKSEIFENNFSKNMVTSNFWKITDIKKDLDGNVTRINLTRYNNGEDKLPYLKNYSIVYFKNGVEAYNAFQKKEIDLLSGIPGSTITKIKDDTNIKFEVAQMPNNFAVFINQNQNEALRDGNLRKAMSDVVDRQSLTNQVLGSFGIPEKDILGNRGSTTPVNTIIQNLGSGFKFENGVLYMSTKKATQTSPTASSNQTPVKITITTIQNTELVETAKFIQLAWKKIGIETDIQIIDRADLNGVVKDRDFEALLFGFSIKNPGDYYSFFSSKERNYPKLNISNYASISADKILNTLQDEKDPTRIADLTEQLSDQISQDNPVIILYKPEFVFAHFLKTQIKLPDTIKSEEDRYQSIAYWYTDTEKVLNVFNKLQFIDKLDSWLY